MEILFCSKVLPENSSVEHFRNYKPEEPCTYTVQIQNPKYLPVEQSSMNTLRSLKKQKEEKKKEEEEDEDKKKKKENYNFATLETLRGNSALVFSWER